MAAAAQLSTVVTAKLSVRGVLLEANVGFLRLLGDDAQRAIGNTAERFFIQPSFAAVNAATSDKPGGEYSGLLTIGDHLGKTWTLRGRVWRAGSQLLVLAEFDIVELERITDSVLELNRELNTSRHALAQANLALKQREAQIVELSVTDALTGLGNRRQLEQALAAEISRSRRTGGKLTVLMADLDHFKQVNDRYGHSAGDKVLVRFAQLLRSEIRPTDGAARFGGEEFVVLLAHTDIAQAAALGNRVRGLLASEAIAPLADPTTVSFGVAELRAKDTGDALLDRADKALYAAKAQGRNRVSIEEPMVEVSLS